MIPFFPQKIANKGILIYLISLAAVSVAFFKHAMGWEYILLGVMWVAGFFLLSSSCSRKWAKDPVKKFAWRVFWAALLLRLAWVVFAYYFYMAKTGQTFEFGAADAVGYHEESKWLAEAGWDVAFQYYGSRSGVSDIGYPFWLTLIYKIFGPSIIIARIVKGILSAITCVLIYKLASRNIGEFPGRMAAIFCTFIPNLIIYCGLHVKETEMIFLIVAFIERADYLIRNRHYNVFTIAIPTLLALSLFFFRTVLGVVALLSLFAGLIFTSSKLVGWGKRLVLILFGIACLAGFAGGTIATEVEGYWEARVENQVLKRNAQTARGNQWAKYATGAVLAPMEFVMPLSTMVDTGQENQMIMHGGNYIRNFFGIFVLLALFYAIFKDKNWRDLSLVGTFTVGYLGVISVSGYGNAERFLLPGLPCLLVMAAYGISKLNARNYKYVKYWYVVVVLMEVAWAYFKIGSRGLL
mgnify:CR=1 FL=1